ncbi:2-C-methyl-D-erythritol 2,4-cyclodiphosphate synthase [Helicobacter bizzozeronii CCUG 35545]|nr:2-C-methyl-D-erythritol 2,4-cyclodiphosphate synthase [Helicobacter bizzozeronii CCUG 35545]
MLEYFVTFINGGLCVLGMSVSLSDFQAFKSMGVSLILPAAGSSVRFLESLGGAFQIKKQWWPLEGMPLLEKVCRDFQGMACFARIFLVVSHPVEQIYLQQRFNNSLVSVILGGKTRQQSVQNALDLVDTPLVMVSDVARFYLDHLVLYNLFSAMHEQVLDCVAPSLPPSDTLIYQDSQVLDRNGVRCVQTPQLCRTAVLKKAYATGVFSDESSAILSLGARVAYISGSTRLHKLTYAHDLPSQPQVSSHSLGIGFDVHGFEPSKVMKIGGVQIDPKDSQQQGFRAHSDGDVLLHALIDALLGAIKGGDIGMYYSDENSAYVGIDSALMLQSIYGLVQNLGHVVVGIDATLFAQIPKIAPYRTAICQNLAKLLKIQPHQINLKATTTEGLGFIGRKEGVGAQVLVQTSILAPTQAR